MIKELKRIGYWKSAFKMDLPHPINFVDPNWDPFEKGRVIAHLKDCKFMPYMAAGHSHCRICEIENNGYREKSDGVYLWPEGFLHYVTAHDLRPPKEFIEHCLEDPKKPNLDHFDFDGMKALEINDEWWRHQKGNNPAALATFDDPFEYTYPVYYTLSRKEYNRKNLKKEYLVFLKTLSDILKKSFGQIHQELKDEHIIIDQETYHLLQSVKDYDTFVKVTKAENSVQLEDL